LILTRLKLKKHPIKFKLKLKNGGKRRKEVFSDVFFLLSLPKALLKP